MEIEKRKEEEEEFEKKAKEAATITNNINDAVTPVIIKSSQSLPNNVKPSPLKTASKSNINSNSNSKKSEQEVYSYEKRPSLGNNPSNYNSSNGGSHKVKLNKGAASNPFYIDMNNPFSSNSGNASEKNNKKFIKRKSIDIKNSNFKK